MQIVHLHEMLNPVFWKGVQNVKAYFFEKIRKVLLICHLLN